MSLADATSAVSNARSLKYVGGENVTSLTRVGSVVSSVRTGFSVLPRSEDASINASSRLVNRDSYVEKVNASPSLQAVHHASPGLSAWPVPAAMNVRSRFVHPEPSASRRLPESRVSNRWLITKQIRDSAQNRLNTALPMHGIVQQ